ncbi:MAG: aminoglycoside phosphotransferase family protein [Chloroflexia bacterium]|nr:aminoglycoside phosphotransferase family protein [Chloroflexia bacterium]
MEDILAALQQDADAYCDNTAAVSAWQRAILSRLHDYVALVIHPFKLRVRTLALQQIFPQRIEVRVTGTSVVTVVFAPSELLAGEVAFLRACALKQLPVPKIIHVDISYNFLPVGFVLYNHITGTVVADVTDATLQRQAARQVGRTLRVLHALPMAGWGWPTTTQKWELRDWRSVLKRWFNETAGIERLRSPAAVAILARFWREIIQDDIIEKINPCCIHGNLHMQHVYVTVHSHVQLEGVVRPGIIVAGDPMFDLAATMRTTNSLAFRQGIIEGYTATVPLRPEEILRIKQLAVVWRIYDLLIDNTVEEQILLHSITTALDGLIAA